MAIQLTEDLEQLVNDAVQAGLYARQDDVIRDALTRLRQTFPPPGDTPGGPGEAAREATPGESSVTPEELNRRLLASGLVVQFPDPSEDDNDPEDFPIEIPGEPLSETIIRERR